MWTLSILFLYHVSTSAPVDAIAASWGIALLPEFGAFSEVFEKGKNDAPGYLPLLNLGEDAQVRISVDRVNTAFRARDPRAAVGAMLAQDNWRPHLVAAIAFLLDQNPVLDRGLLWTRISRGSWVTPQLVVAAMFTDSNFAQRAIDLVERAGDLDGKLVASVFGLRAFVPSIKHRSAAWRQNPRFLLALNADADESGEIAARWARTIRKHFARRRILLTPASGRPEL